MPGRLGFAHGEAVNSTAGYMSIAFSGENKDIDQGSPNLSRTIKDKTNPRTIFYREISILLDVTAHMTN